ncbi:MAG: tRNA preQ1(34) S-adenosylmethionine ribosyltransferase-isomerase QueA [Gammaproteobacteria bacterium]|nr:tRNA preQ1(34) S-adenosylmethionine ribosyltransferase-isomerase QueA [Gammaproteobacteria bacterium]
MNNKNTQGNDLRQELNLLPKLLQYELPKHLIAQYPTVTRSSSRLLDSYSSDSPSSKWVADLPNILKPHDLVIFNNTKVIKARLKATKSTGGRVEILVERMVSDESSPEKRVLAQMSNSKNVRKGDFLSVGAGEFIKVIERPLMPTERFFLLEFQKNALDLLEQYGELPLPNYIGRKPIEQDLSRYQTIFAKIHGAVAAPTASLHFDEALIASLRKYQIQTAEITLHIGAGTFVPIKGAYSNHTMHKENYMIPSSTIELIHECRQKGGKVVAVGTTVVRALESWAIHRCTQGDTDLYITPGFEFKMVDGLFTNFHLPNSTLLLLVAAFSGVSNTLRNYTYAMMENFRFYSYGDAMLVGRF